MHMNILQFIYPLIMGIMFAVVLDKTKCLKLTMLLHFCNNFLVLIVDYFSEVFSFSLNIQLSATIIFLIFLGALIGIFLALFLTTKLSAPKSENIDQTLLENEAQNQNQNEKETTNQSEEKFLIISLVVAVLFWLIIFITTLKG